MDPFTGTIGEIRMFAGNFAPRGWAYCAGQLIAISQNDALFSILGTNFGGDGRTSFGLPDLRGRAAISSGQGPGLSFYREGQKGGWDGTTLTQASLASHTHGITGTVDATINHVAVDAPGNTGEPDGASPATLTGVNAYANEHDGAMLPDQVIANSNLMVTNVGGQQAFNNESPYLTMNYIIALFGVYPSRS